MPPWPSDEAAPRTGSEDYTVISLQRVCQGCRKGRSSMLGSTTPLSFPAPPPLPLCPGCGLGLSSSGKCLVSCQSQDGSPATPSLTDVPRSPTLLLECALTQSLCLTQLGSNSCDTECHCCPHCCFFGDRDGSHARVLGPSASYTVAPPFWVSWCEACGPWAPRQARDRLLSPPLFFPLHLHLRECLRLLVSGPAVSRADAFVLHPRLQLVLAFPSFLSGPLFLSLSGLLA